MKSDNTAPPIQAKGYSEAGASLRRKALKAFLPSSGSAQEDIDFNNRTLRQRSRILMMSTPIVTSAIKTQRTNVVGQGLKLQSTIDREVLGLSEEEAQEWQRNTEREFNLWAENKRNCDATGINNFYGMQQLVMTSWLASGDVFALVKHNKTSRLQPYSLRLHIIEADRVCTPWQNGNAYMTITTAQAENGNYIFDGVEVDASGLPVAYHICNRYPEEWGRMEQIDWTRVPAIQPRTGLPNILHIMDSERPDQYRGVPYIAPAIELALQLRKYTEHEINAAQLESSLSGFIITANTDPRDNPINSTVDEDQVNYEVTDDEVVISPGTYLHLNEGDTATTVTPTRPAGGFAGFVDAVVKQVGAGLEIPKEILLKEFNSSYSASRAALLEAWKSFFMRRTWLIDDFCNPVYELFLSEAVARGRIQAPGFFTDPMVKAAYLKCAWIGPSQGQLDPVKEITAEIMACSEGFTTHKAATTKLNGSDWRANIAELGAEAKKIAEVGGAPDPHQAGSAKESESPDSEESDSPESAKTEALMKAQKVLNLILEIENMDRKEDPNEC